MLLRVISLVACVMRAVSYACFSWSVSLHPDRRPPRLPARAFDRGDSLFDQMRREGRKDVAEHGLDVGARRGLGFRPSSGLCVGFRLCPRLRCGSETGGTDRNGTGRQAPAGGPEYGPRLFGAERRNAVRGRTQ